MHELKKSRTLDLPSMIGPESARPRRCETSERASRQARLEGRGSVRVGCAGMERLYLLQDDVQDWLVPSAHLSDSWPRYRSRLVRALTSSLHIEVSLGHKMG